MRYALRIAAAAAASLLCAAAAYAAADDVSVKAGGTTVTFNIRYPVIDGSWEDYTGGVDLFGRKRIGETSSAEYGPYRILNGKYVFMPVTIPSAAAREYAATVAEIADSVPDGCTVYNMIVPDAYELFAPEKYSTKQIDMIESVYRRIGDAVPVDITRALTMRSDEKIYFYTDHHWTQRGAYYAWQYFAKLRGTEIPDLSEFENCPTELTGSFAAALPDDVRSGVENGGTETMERFIPIHGNTGKVYGDRAMTDFIFDIKTVNPDEDSYNTFIAGDCPLTVLESDIANGRRIAIIKESVGNPLATWAVNDYERVYVIDLRGFPDGSFDIGGFCADNGIDDVLIESYPESIISDDLRGMLEGLM